MYSFDHQSGDVLSLDGARIYYETQGERGQPTLVFLHGGFGSIEDFNGLLSRLPPRYFLVGIDSRGQGASTPGDAPLSYQQIQRDVQRVIAHLKLGAFSLVGLSDGGIVGYRLAALHSLPIRKLVTIGAHWRLASDDPVRAIYARVTPEGWRKKFPLTYTNYQRWNPALDFDATTRALVRMWLDTSPAGYPQESIRGIRTPLLMVRGHNDPFVPLEAAVQITRRIPGAQLLNIPFAEHVAFDDQPEIFMPALQAFLAR